MSSDISSEAVVTAHELSGGAVHAHMVLVHYVVETGSRVRFGDHAAMPTRRPVAPAAPLPDAHAEPTVAPRKNSK
jgi:hypothetical protein